MNKMQASLVALTALTASASAADLPRREAPPPVFSPVPVFTWTGFYAGFNAGYGFGSGNDGSTSVVYGAGTNAVILPNFGSPSVDGTVVYNDRSTDGFTGGAQIGYNYQLTPGNGIVIGVEADAQYLDFGRRNRAVTPVGSIGGVPTAGALPDPLGVAAFAPDFQPVNPNGLSSLDYFGTVRGRLGYAFDRVLVYGTGGFAYGSGEAAFRSSGRGDDFRTGYAVGGGFEYALPTDTFLNFFKSSAVTFKVEGLYVSLDRNRTNNGIVGFNTTTGATLLANDPNVTVVGATSRRQDEFAVVRAGINYKFGSY